MALRQHSVWGGLSIPEPVNSAQPHAPPSSGARTSVPKHFLSSSPPSAPIIPIPQHDPRAPKPPLRPTGRPHRQHFVVLPRIVSSNVQRVRVDVETDHVAAAQQSSTDGKHCLGSMSEGREEEEPIRKPCEGRGWFRSSVFFGESWQVKGRTSDCEGRDL